MDATFPDAPPLKSGSDAELEGLREELADCRATEAGLRMENANLTALEEASVAAIIVRSLDGAILNWNRGAEAIYGYSASEALGRPISILVAPGHLETWSKAFEAANGGEGLDQAEAATVTKDGKPISVLVSVSPVKDSTGGVVRAVVVLRDNTAEKSANEGLREYAARLEALSQRILNAQEIERARIARELHDELGQILTNLRLDLQSMHRSPQAAALAPQLEASIASVDKAIKQVRTLSFDLRPSVLDDLGLAAALRSFLDETANKAGIRAVFAGQLRAKRLPPGLETTIYRVAQEAATNSIRHSSARHLWVELSESAQEVTLQVRDDGIGFDLDRIRASAQTVNRLGLLGMEERTRLAGGQFEITSKSGKGCTVTARFPRTSAASPEQA